jgi:integral membrane protein
MQALRHLRLVAFLEGLSFIALLFIAMPLKYMADLPMAVRVTGSLHGLLFLAFVYVLFRAATEHEWSMKRSAGAFVSSLVPFGTFVLDRELKREIERGRP